MAQFKVQQNDFTKFWPMLLDYSRRECYQLLRRLELEAYGKLVSVFRAQGVLTSEKRRFLHKLQRFLSVSSDRHKAEVRRALNDEELATISETICGKEVTEEWILEGKRVAPILHRPSPVTAYLQDANTASYEQLSQNCCLPPPCETVSSRKSVDPLRKDRRLFDMLSLKKHEQPAKVTMADKSTETSRSLCNSPILVELDSMEKNQVSVPRAEYEVTCETESAMTLFTSTPMENGYVQSSAQPTTFSDNSVRAQKEPYGSQYLGHLHNHYGDTDSQQSHQDNSTQLTLDNAVSMGKLHELVHSSVVKSTVNPMTIYSSQSPRKRTVSANLIGEVPTTSSTLLNLVHAPTSFSMTMGRRVVTSHALPSSTNTPEVQVVIAAASGNPAMSYAARLAQPSMHKAHSTIGTKTALHCSNVLTAAGISQSPARSQSQLVLQMCSRSASEPARISDISASTYQRVPSNSATSLFVPTRPTPSPIGRTYSHTTASQQVNHFKTPTVEARVQPVPRTIMRTPTSDASELRSFAITANPTISIVQSFQGVPNSSNRFHGVSTVVLPHVDSSSRLGVGSSLLTKTTIPLAALPTNQLLSETVTNADSTIPPTKRLVCSTSTLLMPPSSNTSNSNSNNVVVFQRAPGRKQPSSTIKLSSMPVGMATCITSTSVATVTTSSSGLIGNRPIRILGLPATLIASTATADPLFNRPSVALSACPVSLPSTPSESDEPAPPTEDFIPALLHRASSLRASLDVDLDADETGLQEFASTHHISGSLQSSTMVSGGQPDGAEFENDNDLSTVPRSELTESSNVHVSPTVCKLANSSVDVTAGLKVGQLRAILGLSVHPVSVTQTDESSAITTIIATSSSTSSAEHTSVPIPSQLSYSAAEDWTPMHEDLTSDAPEPKLPDHPRSFVTYSDAQATRPNGLLICRHILSRGDNFNCAPAISELLTPLLSIATDLVHCAASDDAEPQTLSAHFSEYVRTVDRLRTIRRWLACTPNLSIPKSELEQTLENILTVLTNFFDALLLVLYKGDCPSTHWQTCTPDTQSETLLALSITLQCLSNLLSAVRTLDISLPILSVRALLAVLLSGSRMNLLLDYGSEHPFFPVHAQQLDRLNSYTSLLLYFVLLYFDLSPNELDQTGLNLVYCKLLTRTQLLTSICRCATDVMELSDNASLLQAKRLHYQLLLCQLAKLFVDFEVCKSSPVTSSCSSQTSLDDLLAATGLVLLRQHDHVPSSFGSANGKGYNRTVPQTVRPCLLFWRIAQNVCPNMEAFIDNILSFMDTVYATWSEKMESFLAEPVTDCCAPPDQSIFSYAPLRGVVHILAEVAFSNISKPPYRLADESNAITELDFKHSITSSTEEFVFRLSDAQGIRLWDCLCDILVLLSLGRKHIESQSFALHSSEKSSIRTVKGEDCTVFPSRLSSTLPTLSATSPGSLCQAFGFKQDCIRCMAGLLSHTPSLSVRLASHTTDHLGIRLVNPHCQSALDALLESTNREPENPFACEWAVLTIKLSVNPEGDNPVAMEGARVLACRLQDMHLIPESESQLGRWPKDSKSHSPLDSENKLDRYFIRPLGQQLNLTVVATVKLLRFVCSTTDEFMSSDSLGGRLSDPTQFRLELLNPSRVLIDVFDPLSHVGVRHPHKLLAACPELLLSSATRVESLTSSHETVFTQALDELSSLLPRNDLISLLNRFPGVLVRSKQELQEIHTYLTEQMGLQSTESVRAAHMRAHRHFLRHATGLRLVNCPAWCLPLAHVRARHSIALLAGCWPPATVSSAERKVSADQLLTGLLTCPNSRVPFWLGMESGQRTFSAMSKPIVLSPLDVDVFHFIFSRTLVESDDFPDKTECSSMNERT
ncbi:hypothetical protein PHET_02726 [Paragonimus heterotremus]|uniref:ENT domain-containing protein n=1 Tax=Paragonimus heterotremus TaxID=100268 RepID=A0A8J4TPV8_9TREM|nr:hypothetical protein PHET_02726 [Paragonimus heterotremus]